MSHARLRERFTLFVGSNAGSTCDVFPLVAQVPKTEDPRSRITSRCLAAIAVLCLFSTPTPGQEATAVAPATVSTGSTTALVEAPVSLQLPAREEGREEVNRLRKEVTSLKQRVEDTARDLQRSRESATLFLTLLSFLAIVPQLVSFGLANWQNRPAEERARQSHAISVQSHTLSLQSHQTLLSSSQQTLTLVNDTLSLAKAASERADKILKEKADKALKDLDFRARRLIADASDAKAFVENADIRAALRSLAQKINNFDITTLFLPQELTLTAPCLFLRGMDLHLEQRFADALEMWDAVTLDTAAQPDLRATALYWIGYENNNLGNFKAAAKAFGAAKDLSEGGQRLELERILIETRFFASRPEDLPGLVTALEVLLEELRDRGEEDRAVRAKVLVTSGNVVFSQGLELSDLGQAEQAKECFRIAHAWFAEAAVDNRWAAVGQAECLYRLGSVDEAAAVFRSRVREFAIDEYTHRDEPRTKVLAKTTELLCCLRVPGLEDQAQMVLGQVQEALGRVNDQLTVYSQFRKKNVKKRAFTDELRNLEELKSLVQG